MRIAIVSIGVLLLIVGCASTDTVSRKGNADQSILQSADAKMITITAKGGQLKLDPKEYIVREFDRNGDKKTDIVNVLKKGIEGKGEEEGTEPQIFIKMMDLNLDGKYDVYRFYDEAGAVAKEELDLDFDGKIETIDFYVGGIVMKKEIDSQFDEKTDIWKYYDEKGILIKLEEDQDGDGAVDYWEYYAGGVLERIEKDTDRDARPDVFKKEGDLKFTTIIRNDGKFETVGPSPAPTAPKKEEPAVEEAPAPKEEPATPKEEPATPKEEPVTPPADAPQGK
jgi:hypothetical protein